MLQVPTDPETLHATQDAVHAVSQHTPSTQNPALHWFAPAHGLPSASFGTQDPLRQYAEELQAASLEQEVAHDEPLQA